MFGAGAAQGQDFLQRTVQPGRGEPRVGLLVQAQGHADGGIDVRAQLTSRGLPAGLVDQVAAVAADAAARGLPTAPLANKALEGWEKKVPAPRIVSVLEQFAARMGNARDAVRAAGVPNPPGEVVSAAAAELPRKF